ncbi:hypothetical protein M0R01_00980 [bacterium]|nr:hypothetical protein [bacterium]
MNFEDFVFGEDTVECGPLDEDVCYQAMSGTEKYLDKVDSTEDAVIFSPEKKKDDVPVFYAPGWAVKADTNSVKGVMKLMSDQGREVISSSFKNRKKIIDAIGEDNKYYFQLAELHKSLLIVDTIRDLGIEQCDIVGYSEGGINASIAACLLGEKSVRNLVLVCPAGMIGKDSCFDLIRRFAITEEVEEIRKREQKDFNSTVDYTGDIIEYMVKNPKFTRDEIKAMTEIDLFKMTKYLKGKGVGVGLVCGANDKVFPIEQALDKIEENVDYLVSTKGNHGSIVFEKEHILLAENLLTNMALDANREKYKNSK